MTIKHTAGIHGRALAFLWPYQGRVLFAADTANPVLGLDWHFFRL